MSAHTPGQWFIEQELPTERPGIETNADGKFFSVVVWGDSTNDNDDGGVHGRTPEEAMANARLIAAAPDLLEALGELLNTPLDCDVKTRLAVISKCNAAIAKAKGGNQ